MPPPAPVSLLSLISDILALIIDLLSVEDARTLRLCSKRADVLFSAHALSQQELQLLPNRTAQRVARLLEHQRDRLPLVQCLALTKFENDTLDAETATAVLRLLRQTPGVRELHIDTSDALLSLTPELLAALARLPRLQTLVLADSGETVSASLLGGGDTPLAATLTHLTLGVLNFGRTGPRPVPQLHALRSLSVKTLRGPLEPLVAFAPLLTNLTLTHAHNIVASHPNLDPDDNTGRGWTTLVSVTGSPRTLARLAPLFRCSVPVHRVVFKHEEDEVHDPADVDARGIAPTLRALRPAYIEFAGRVDWAHVCEDVAVAAPQRMVYLRLRVPRTGDRWMLMRAESDLRPDTQEILNMYSKKFTALRCLDLDLRDMVIKDEISPRLWAARPTRRSRRAVAQFDSPVAQFDSPAAQFDSPAATRDAPGTLRSLCLANEVHYLSCKVPTLRFLLADGARRPIEKLLERPQCLVSGGGRGERVPGTVQGLVFGKSAGRDANWQRGRREGTLDMQEVQRVRDVFREGKVGVQLVRGGESIL
ncbi:hypothetical protein EIP86_009259 [Pleurotus ostreatoroseus]|nr:hypothetical protein EIP86_009259 [Pleurotus ostreatoroseus]